MKSFSRRFPEPRLAVRAIDIVAQSLSTLDEGVRKEELQGLIESSGCDERERKIALELLDEANVGDDQRITLKEWLDFMDLLTEETLQEGKMKNCQHKVMKWFDTFDVETWDSFQKYDQASMFGAVLGLTVRVVFVLVIILNVRTYWLDSNSTVLKQIDMNDYSEATLNEFFFYFRTPWREQVNDPTLFSFEMSIYVKRPAGPSGEVIEEYFPVELRFVTKADLDWWPDSVDANVTAVAPLHPQPLAGAYHLENFQQIELRLSPCRNSTLFGGGTDLVCKPTEEIHAAMHGAFVILVMQTRDQAVVTSRTAQWIVKSGETNQIDLWFNRQVYIITAKYEFVAEEVTAYMAFTSVSEQIAPLWQDGTLAVWWFSQSPQTLREKIVRGTLGQLVASCGGTWATLFSVFGLAALFHNRRKLAHSLELLRVRSLFAEDLRILSVMMGSSTVTPSSRSSRERTSS